MPDNDKRFIEDALNVLLAISKRRLNEIVNFFNNYYKVYIRYKHVFSAFIGLAYLDEKSKRIPRIFMRDYEKKLEKKYCTYVLPSNIGTIEYYERLNDHILKMFQLLLSCHIHHIQNCGKPFLFSDGYFLPVDKKEYWMKIVKEVNIYSGIPRLPLTINVEGDEIQKMLQALSKNHIYRYDKDILEKMSLGIR